MRNSLLAGVGAMIGLGVSMAALGAARAQEGAQEGERLVLRMAGDRAWRVECVLNKDDGGQSKPKARGRGGSSTGSVVAFDVVSGQCAVEAGNRGALRVTLDPEADAFKCPFGEPEEGALCQKIFAADAKDNIEISLK